MLLQLYYSCCCHFHTLYTHYNLTSQRALGISSSYSPSCVHNNHWNYSLNDCVNDAVSVSVRYVYVCIFTGNHKNTENIRDCETTQRHTDGGMGVREWERVQWHTTSNTHKTCSSSLSLSRSMCLHTANGYGNICVKP